MLLWTPIATAMSVISTIATGMTMLSLRRNWDLQVSSVRWLFFYFFVYCFLWCLSRTAYFIWILLLPARKMVDTSTNDPYTYAELDRLGLHAIIFMKESQNGFIAAILCFGDAMLFGVALWMFPLTYELSKIATKSMDRGVEKERAKIKFYSRLIHGILLAFVALETTMAIVSKGYTKSTHMCQLGVYFVQFISLAYMVVLLLQLRMNGRKYETIHGVFVASPVYQRLKRIMVVYAVFSFQFQLSSVILYGGQIRAEPTLSYIGASLIMYQASGLALAVTTSCSQACVLDMCGSCLPDDIEAQLQARVLHGEPSTPRDNHTLDNFNEPPRVNPVFVFTDIESSSALWAIGDGRIMQRATEIHDNILRSALTKYRGYEITTAGDAFHLCFHTIREATEYCLDVQLQLLVAHWPKELHGLVPATRRQRAGHRLIFGGLRVRMGIHDAADADGTLVHNIHAVTGKMTYTGASEVIANEVGDLGDGGQILVTQRVADWLQMYEDLVAVECTVDHVGAYSIPQINANLQVYQVTPEVLAGRKKVFSKRLRRRVASVSFVGAPASLNGRTRLASHDPTPSSSMSRHASHRNFTIPHRIGYYQRATSM
uniref:Guanylate cyclase domain-containing protein n=1 Tax=Globisporangium ultimum (strain ATCC 200006 / CBS 805.95 / DAOM BR144) TaxID=431595 RepID=K3X9B2_GLOUD